MVGSTGCQPNASQAMSHGFELQETLAFIRQWPSNCSPGEIELANAYQRAIDALTAIREITGQTYSDKDRTYTALSQIDQIARKGLAP